jgi:hypothetical protein
MRCVFMFEGLIHTLHFDFFATSLDNDALRDQSPSATKHDTCVQTGCTARSCMR